VRTFPGAEWSGAADFADLLEAMNGDEVKAVAKAAHVPAKASGKAGQVAALLHKAVHDRTVFGQPVPMGKLVRNALRGHAKATFVRLEDAPAVQVRRLWRLVEMDTTMPLGSKRLSSRWLAHFERCPEGHKPLAYEAYAVSARATQFISPAHFRIWEAAVDLRAAVQAFVDLALDDLKDAASAAKMAPAERTAYASWIAACDAPKAVAALRAALNFDDRVSADDIGDGDPQAAEMSSDAAVRCGALAGTAVAALLAYDASAHGAAVEALPVFLRPRDAGAVLAKAVWPVVDVLEHTKEYAEASRLLRALLGTGDRYLQRSRGEWWNRLVVDLGHQGEEGLRSEALAAALADPAVRGRHRDDILKRAEKKAGGGASTPNEGDGATDGAKEKKRVRYTLPRIDHQEGRRRKSSAQRSRFIDYSDEGKDVDVEELCCQWYAFPEQGQWRGWHCEGGPLKVLFGLLLWSELFAANVPDVFQSPYQDVPLDVGYECFYRSRKRAIDARLAAVAAASPAQLAALVLDAYVTHYRVANRFVSWDRGWAVCWLQAVAVCFGGPCLSAILLTLAVDNTWSGLPDLLLLSATDRSGTPLSPEALEAWAGPPQKDDTDPVPQALDVDDGDGRTCVKRRRCCNHRNYEGRYYSSHSYSLTHSPHLSQVRRQPGRGQGPGGPSGDASDRMDLQAPSGRRRRPLLCGWPSGGQGA